MKVALKHASDAVDVGTLPPMIELDLVELDSQTPICEVTIRRIDGTFAKAFLSAKAMSQGVQFTLVAKTKQFHEETKRTAIATFGVPVLTPEQMANIKV